MGCYYTGRLSGHGLVIVKCHILCNAYAVFIFCIHSKSLEAIATRQVRQPHWALCYLIFAWKWRAVQVCESNKSI